MFNVSKTYKRQLFNQIDAYFDGLFSKYQCSFQQELSSQYCLIAMLKKWKTIVDKGKNFAVLLGNLSKDFDCLPHNLIIAQLNPYGFSFSLTRFANLSFAKVSLEKILRSN